MACPPAVAIRLLGRHATQGDTLEHSFHAARFAQEMLVGCFARLASSGRFAVEVMATGCELTHHDGLARVLCRYLLEHGAGDLLESSNSDMNTPLMVACDAGSLEVAQVLVRRSALEKSSLRIPGYSEHTMMEGA